MSRTARRIVALTVAALVVVSILLVRNRESSPPTVAIFNLLSHPILNASVAGIKEGLAEEGYTGKAVRLLEVNANGDMNALNGLAIELLSAAPDVIVPVSTPVTQAVVAEADSTQNIVFSTVTNPANVGMDKHPSNMTGVSDAVNYQANLDLIAELFPADSVIGIVYNPGERNSQFGVDEVKKLAPAMGMRLELAAVSRSDEVLEASRALLSRCNVIYVGSDNTVVSAIAAVTEAAYEAGKPVIASDAGSVEGGALAAVSVDYQALGREAGKIVAGLLRSGDRAGSVSPVTFVGNTLVLNLDAAKRIGFRFPDAVLARAAKILPER